MSTAVTEKKKLERLQDILESNSDQIQDMIKHYEEKTEHLKIYLVEFGLREEDPIKEEVKEDSELESAPLTRMRKLENVSMGQTLLLGRLSDVLFAYDYVWETFKEL